MSTNDVENNENKIIEKNIDESQQIVVESQPKTGETQQKPKLSSTEELALLGLRPNEHSDPCLCCGFCIFCFEICFSATGGAPPLPQHKRLIRKAVGKHNWDNDSHDDDDNDGDYWFAHLATNITGHTSDGTHTGGGDHHCSDGGHDGGHGCDGGGGDGGGGDGGGD